MKTYIPCIAIVLFFVNLQLRAQEPTQLIPRDSIIESSWILGLGYNIVDDSGDVFDGLFSIKEQWNAVPYPSRLSMGRYFKSGVGVEAIASYNQYGEGKVIDGRINDTDKNYWGIDARLSYDLNRLLGETGWFDPYVGIGAGYTDANELPRGTYNAVIGFRTWFSDKWGLDFNSSGKWSFGTTASNHIQHAAGVVYRFGIQKGVGKEGIEKPIEEMPQTQVDSLASDTLSTESDSALAERLEREKESARLQQEEADRLLAESERKQGIQDAINAVGKVYFELNSSYLRPNAKKQLDQLADILEDNPAVTLRIVAHADSRGANKYNQWLSERRAQRTMDYLVNKGIATDRLGYEGQGEEQLTNHCKDNVPCTGLEHSANRRTEFIITKF